MWVEGACLPHELQDPSMGGWTGSFPVQIERRSE